MKHLSEQLNQRLDEGVQNIIKTTLHQAFNPKTVVQIIQSRMLTSIGLKVCKACPAAAIAIVPVLLYNGVKNFQTNYKEWKQIYNQYQNNNSNTIGDYMDKCIYTAQVQCNQETDPKKRQEIQEYIDCLYLLRYNENNQPRNQHEILNILNTACSINQSIAKDWIHLISEIYNKYGEEIIKQVSKIHYTDLSTTIDQIKKIITTNQYIGTKSNNRLSDYLHSLLMKNKIKNHDY